ncbi:type I-E CRISPR-associated protein Cse1/CasA [Nocardiopsis sp. NPDC101807]|uniref:type I-E CRISPR-associated protein Cse1/CasA n=1 Tax=Nocardiopsis sp. NPDC101807 TaxID=3364339 RepID=UPI00380AB8CC
MTSPSFDLTTEPWLPVRLPDGTAGPPVGLRELLCRAHEFSDVELPLPPASAQLWRVLALVTARITRLDTSEGATAWQKRRRDVLRTGRLPEDGVDAYLAPLRERFDLFHPERPWLQDPRLRDECSKSSGVNKLAWGRTAGQNQVWLGGHHHDLDPVPLTPAEAAWHLLATLGYGPSGRCTSRTVDGRSEANSTAGPLRGTVSFHPVGRNLFESLVLNIPLPQESEYEDDESEPAPWERADLPNPLGLPEESSGPAGVLVNQARHAVLLSPSADGSQVVDAHVTWALRERQVAPTDPYLIHLTSKDGRRYARPADASRAVWRDLESLLAESTRERFRPELFTQLTSRAHLPLDLRESLRLRAFGFDQDGQTRDRQWFTAGTPPVLRWLQESSESAEGHTLALTRVKATRDAAERTGRRLRDALISAWKESNSPSGGSAGTETGSGPWLRTGTARYWSTAETLFWRTVMDEDSAGPGNGFILLALRAYDEVTSSYCFRPRVAKAVESHRRRLFDGWTRARTDEEDAA